MKEVLTPTLEALMVRLSEGDRAAFTPLFDSLWKPVLQFCKNLLRNDANADDAAQQALEKVFTRANDYDGRRPVMPWVLAIASWECRTILRKQTRRREVFEAEAPAQALEGAGLAGADEEHIQQQLVQAALSALGTLSTTDQEALMATFWDQAASVQGATLRKRRERALDRLKEAFRRLYGFG